jgi:zinc protease
MNVSLRPSGYAETNAATIPAIPPGVKLSTLENGLTLIIREDHSAPVVSAQAWCKAGSIDEGKWLGAGLSHVLEHMLFKGTTTRAAGRIDQEVQDAGGYMNAYTSFDRTVYWINVPNTGAKVAIDILCDIVQNATLPADEMVKEKQVILREMDMNQDDPSQRSARRLFETAYTRSPYRFTIIGYPDIYNEVQRDDVFAYYREKYAPNNLFFVVAGDVKADEVEKQIREAFAKTKARAMPPAVLPEEPKQVAAREMIEEAPIEMGHFHFSWHIPDLRHPDVALLDILATLLGAGRSSRLYQEVREKGLVNSVDAWTYSPGNPGLFGMSAVVEPDKFNEARAAMLAEMERMKTNLVSAEELGKAIKQFTAATLASRKTMQGQAQDLGSSWMAANDLNFSARYLETVKRATPGDLQRVAQQYLTAENRTLYALLPTGTAPKTIEAKDQFADNAVQKFEFANGLRLLVKEDHRLPFVEFRLVFRGGVLAETAENNGVSLLTAKMLLKGTSTRSAEAIASEIESLGGSIESYSGNNSFGVNAEVLSTDFTTGLDLVADVVLRPSFPTGALERERQIQLAGIRAQRDELLPTASKMMRRGMFGDVGYGLHTNGTEKSVQKIGVADLKRFHDGFVRPNNCVLAIFGDVKADAVRAAVDKYFGAWPKGGKVIDTNALSAALTEIKRMTETRDKKQAVMVIGFPGTTLHNDDRYVLELIQEACSDLGSRVFVRIREKLGLAYYVGAQNFLGIVPGFFAFYVGTEPEKVALVETELLKEAEALRAEGLTEEELKRAKAKVIGQKKISRQDLGTFAMNSALDEIYGLGYAHTDIEDEKYEAVTLEQTKAVAQKYLKPESLVVAIVKPGEK